MKKTFFLLSLSLVLLILFVVACSEDRAVNGAGSPHPAGFGDSTSANFHGGLGACESCHGAQYGTHFASGSCRNCHTGQPSPTLVGCGTCHATPPVDDAGLPAGMLQGVNAAGAHRFHALDRGYACTECHRGGYISQSPEWTQGAAHVDSLPGDLNFVNATLPRARGYQPGAEHVGPFNSGNATCAVYCHSNGKGSNFSMEQRQPVQPVPQWTAQNVTFACNSCHNIPPAPPHPQVLTCHNCHSNVDPTSNYPSDIRLINPDLHINGTVNF